MIHFAAIAPALAGHWNPLAALAGELVARGHRVTFLHQPSAAALLRDRRLGFHPVGGAAPDYASRLREHAAHVGLLSGIGRIVHHTAELTELMCDELPAALQGIGAQAVLADEIEPAGALVAWHLGLPLVSLANALLINRDRNLPPPFTDWGYDPSPLGRWRNRGGWRVHHALMRGIDRPLAARARQWGMRVRHLEDCLSSLAQISQTVAGFDFPRATPPAALHHVGPLRGEEGIWPKLAPGAPVVYASLGTLQGGRVRIFERIAAACAARGVRLVIAHGGRLPAGTRLPGEPELHDYVPQRALIRQVDAVVTHGGLNTTLDALAAGKPVVAIPLAFEQGAIAARLVHSGAGVAVRPRDLARRLPAALDRVLGDPAPRAAAQRLAREIAGAGGVKRAADLVEQAVGVAHARAHAA